MNKVFLSGRLTRDIEFKQGGTVDIAKTGIAVDRRMKKGESDFFNLVAFGKTAEFLHRYFAKGSKIIIEGRLNFSQYEKEGKKLSSVTVIIDTMEFADSKKKASNDLEGEYIPNDETPF